MKLSFWRRFFECLLSFWPRPYELGPYVLRSFVPGRACEHSNALATPIFRFGFLARQSFLQKCAAGVSQLRLFCHLLNYRATIFWLQP